MQVYWDRFSLVCWIALEVVYIVDILILHDSSFEAHCLTFCMKITIASLKDSTHLKIFFQSLNLTCKEERDSIDSFSFRSTTKEQPKWYVPPTLLPINMLASY